MGSRSSAFIAVLLVAVLLVPPSMFSDEVSAQGIDETLADEWVETQYNITFMTFSDIQVDVRFEIYEADLDQPMGVPASTFRSKLSTDPELQQEYLQRAEQDLRDTINGTLGALDLKNATVQVNAASVLDIGENVTGDIYREPVTLGTSGRVIVNPACLGLPQNANVDSLVRGTLNMGGILNLSVEIKAKPGHLNRFHIIQPSRFLFQAGGALTSTRDLTVDARGSLVNISQNTYVALVSANPARLNERTDAVANVDIQELDLVQFRVNISIFAVDSTRISPHFPLILGINLVSADGIRMAVDEGLLTWDDIYAYSVKDQVDALEGQLSGFLSGPLSLDFAWDGASLDGYDVNTMKGGPVRATLTGTGALDLKGMTKTLAQKALWSGAKVPFEIAISNSMNWSIQMTLPKNMTLEGTGLAPIDSIDGREVFLWNKGSNPLKGFFVRNNAWVPERNGTVNVRLEVKDVDYDLAKVLGQKRTTVRFKIGVTISLESLPIDKELQQGLPAGVTIERANADLMRELLAEGRVNRSEIDTIVEDLSRTLTLQLSTAVGKDVDFRVFIDEPTLKPNATGPILLRGSATVSVDKGIDSKDNVAAFIDVAKKFYLEGREGWKVVYTIQFPEGIEIFKVDRSLKSSDFKEQPMISKDKRSLVEIIEGDLTDNVTIYVRPTFEKSIAVVLPQPLCIGPIILVLVVIVAAAYYMRVRKHRALEAARHKQRHHARPHHVQGRRPPTRPEALDKYGENLAGKRKLQPHVHKYRLPLKTWKSEDDTEEEELPTPRAPHKAAHITATPPPTVPGKASVPLAQPKPYLSAKPAKPAAHPHITGQPEKFVKCPSCGRRFGIHPEQKTLECPHCGKKGKTAPKRPHITGVPSAQAAHVSKSIKCPRCGNQIVYSKDQETIKCGKCGKEGRVKKKT